MAVAPAGAAAAAAPQVEGLTVSAVGSGSATLEAQINPSGAKTTYHFEYGLPSCSSACTKTKSQSIVAGSSPVAVEASLSGLSAATIYHFRVVASNGAEKTSAFHIFATRSEGSSGGLPDKRAYEEASPVDKDGGDVTGTIGLVKAADDGEGITFNSTFGIPGGKGAQALPTYLAMRGPLETGWSTQGLLLGPQYGERVRVLGWLPDFSETFSNAERLTSPREKALIAQSIPGGPTTTISPYTPEAQYSYVGTSTDASIVVFESQAALPAEEGKEPIKGAIEGRSNVYAWDRGSGRLSLVSVDNKNAAPPKGAFAGPYDWSLGTNAAQLRLGGAARNYYLQETHAITASGDVYFTEAGSGQIYLRLNPTRPQSTMEGGKCLKEADACTIHVSASRRTVPDPAGSQPAAFQAASEDGSEVFFTSSEKLTDDANTGPEQPKPAISAGNRETGAIEAKEFIPKRAVGVAVDSKYVYWADPADGTIGRAELNGGNVEDSFIVPGQTECELEVEEETEPEVFVKVRKKVSGPSEPRYVAVDSEYIYWTNTGPRDENGEPIDGAGTIGRAKIDGKEASVEPEFICGESEPSPGSHEAAVSNPQGIAVSTSHIYWANAARDDIKHSIGWAEIDGEGVEPKFLEMLLTPTRTPYGIAIDAGHIYFSFDEPGPDSSYLERAALDGTERTGFFIGKAGTRGVALNGGYLYWANQEEEAIGRIPVADFPKIGGCEAVPSCERQFVKPTGTPTGLAADSSRLYWSINGDSAANPGNDLYRYRHATDTLEDLTPDPAGDGAEVQGLLGASADGSYLYFVANGDLDGTGKAEAGDCHTSHPKGGVSTIGGNCNLYLRHEGKVRFIAPINGKDSLDWTGTAQGGFSSAGDVPRATFLSSDGKTLLFRSQEKLTEYDNEKVSELYRFNVGDPRLRCVSCPPSGAAVGEGPSLASIDYPGVLGPPLASVGMVQSRNLSANGNRAFFETAEALVPEDTNGDGGCLSRKGQLTPACTDTYEWEAPGEGACTESAAAYSVLDEGCVYLISTGKSPYPSLFADASETGDDVFFFTRQSLVGQDKDELQDVYDARVEGGLASQNQAPPVPCESAEACHGPAQTPPSESSAASATFLGPNDPKPKRKKQKAKKQQHKKKKGRKKSGRANAKGRSG